jgi:hypothetical protein
MSSPVRQFAAVRRQFASEQGVCQFASSPVRLIWRTANGEHTPRTRQWSFKDQFAVRAEVES